MGILNRLSSIFTKEPNSEIGYLTGSIDNSISQVLDTMTDMELQSVIPSATGEWLDLWGNRFGVPREAGESDDSYRNRVLSAVTNQKGTIPALIDAVKRALGDDTEVRVEETYQDLRIFNVSTFSGTGKFQDSDTVRLGVVKIFINKPENEKLREEIWKTKASGVKVIIVEELD
jgi:hypothetical protein